MIQKLGFETRFPEWQGSAVGMGARRLLRLRIGNGTGAAADAPPKNFSTDTIRRARNHEWTQINKHESPSGDIGSADHLSAASSSGNNGLRLPKMSTILRRVGDPGLKGIFESNQGADQGIARRAAPSA